MAEAQPTTETRAPEVAPPDIYRLDRRLTRAAIGLLARLFFRFYAHLKIVGIENVPRTGGVLLAGNHASNLDPVLGWAGLFGYRHLWGIAKSDLFRNKALAYCIHSMGSIPIRRGMVDRSVFKRTLELLAQGDAVGLFPEGALRTGAGSVLHGGAMRDGIARLAQFADVPVLPCVVVGGEKFRRWPAWLPLRRTRWAVAYGEPIFLRSDDDHAASRAALMDDLGAALRALHEEVRAYV